MKKWILLFIVVFCIGAAQTFAQDADTDLELDAEDIDFAASGIYVDANGYFNPQYNSPTGMRQCGLTEEKVRAAGYTQQVRLAAPLPVSSMKGCFYNKKTKKRQIAWVRNLSAKYNRAPIVLAPGTIILVNPQVKTMAYALGCLNPFKADIPQQRPPVVTQTPNWCPNLLQQGVKLTKEDWLKLGGNRKIANGVCVEEVAVVQTPTYCPNLLQQGVKITPEDWVKLGGNRKIANGMCVEEVATVEEEECEDCPKTALSDSADMVKDRLLGGKKEAGISCAIGTGMDIFANGLGWGNLTRGCLPSVGAQRVMQGANPSNNNLLVEIEGMTPFVIRTGQPWKSEDGVWEIKWGVPVQTSKKTYRNKRTAVLYWNGKECNKHTMGTAKNLAGFAIPKKGGKAKKKLPTTGQTSPTSPTVGGNTGNNPPIIVGPGQGPITVITPNTPRQTGVTLFKAQ